MPRLPSLAVAVVLAACGRAPSARPAAAVNVFDHDKLFPITNGEHHVGIACAQCHPFDTFTRFDCLACHRQEDIDPVHLGSMDPSPSGTADPMAAGMVVRDYRYESAACYRCHPTGDCHRVEMCGTLAEDCPQPASMTTTTTAAATSP